MDRIFTKISSAISAAAGQPFAFVAAFMIFVVWGISGPLFAYSGTWQLEIRHAEPNAA